MPELEEQTPRITLPFRFTRRPISIAPDFRKDWKIALLLVILEISSRNGKSSLKRLHVINWAVRTGRHQRQFEETKDERTPMFSFKVRFEPAFSRAIEFAEAQKLIAWVDGDRVQITQVGRSFANGVIKARNVLEMEIGFLKRVGKSISEADASKLLTGARIL
ncbi:MAG: hypothetical protein ABR910_08440 [Acidobacteriaceae bacterium]|jgi:hypothetical protein